MKSILKIYILRKRKAKKFKKPSYMLFVTECFLGILLPSVIDKDNWNNLKCWDHSNESECHQVKVERWSIDFFVVQLLKYNWYIYI